MAKSARESWWTIPQYVTELRARSDEEILRDCRVEAFRGSGPGGQKRNKTSSAVRIVHEPTGIAAVAAESRSQARNRVVALRRLRHRMTLKLRERLDGEGFALPEWFRSTGAEEWLGVSQRGGDYLPVMGLVLDVLELVGWRVSDAARLLGVSTAKLARFVSADEKLLACVNKSRGGVGLKPLRAD